MRRVQVLVAVLLAVFLVPVVSSLAGESEGTLSDTQKSIYETLAVSDKVSGGSRFKNESSFSLPSFESVEAKAVHYKLSDSLWKLSEDYSVRESEKFIAESTGAFDKDKINKEFKDSFRDYLKKNDVIRSDSSDDFEKAKSGFVREDEMADFKDHMKTMDDDKLFKESQKEYKEFLTLEAKAEKNERKLERQDTDKRVAKTESKAEEKAATKTEKSEDKEDDKVAKDDKKDDEKDKDSDKGDKKGKKK